MEKDKIQHILGEKVVALTTLSGGDIAFAQKVKTTNGTYFIKSASFPNAKQLFEKECLGLKILEGTGTIGIPRTTGTFDAGKTSCIILEFIESKPGGPSDMEVFGRKLANLHSMPALGFFGLDTDNFIGKLPQTNTPNQNWALFFVGKRLMPQLKMARDSAKIGHKQLPSFDKLIKVCEKLFGNPVPSLLHGDLWSGNFLISNNGTPYLIDPSVYYGHNEVDLAMTKLFGGFSEHFYGAYHEILPPHPNQTELIDIYQLYYLLVHLNLFGTSYLESVVRILKKYFD